MTTCLTVEKRKLWADKVMASCDALDGLADAIYDTAAAVQAMKPISRGSKSTGVDESMLVYRSDLIGLNGRDKAVTTTDDRRNVIRSFLELTKRTP